MTCDIVFPANARRGRIVLHQVNSISFENSYRTIADFGELVLPRNVHFEKQQSLRSIFRRDDEIEIYFGYNGNNVLEFSGYIKKVSADLPMTIEFEDEMFKIKKLPVNFQSSSISLEKLLKEIIPGYSVDALKGVELGAVRLPKNQVGAALEKLESDWGLLTYMDGKTVKSGTYYRPETVTFQLEKVVSTDLEYQNADDIQIKIKAISTLRNGDKLTVDDIGDAEGNERQLSFYNVESKEELKKLAEREYKKYKVDRFEGSFTAFGIPSVKSGMKCRLISSLYDDRNGTYYIEKVVKSFDNNGIRQIINLGDKA